MFFQIPIASATTTALWLSLCFATLARSAPTSKTAAVPEIRRCGVTKKPVLDVEVVVYVMTSYYQSFLTKAEEDVKKNSLIWYSKKQTAKLEAAIASSKAAQALLSKRDSNFLGRRATAAPVTVITPMKQVKVAFHVIRANETYAGGSLSSQQINRQITVMNQRYNPFGVNFTLTSRTFSTNESWFNTVGPDSDNQLEMKKALNRRPSPDTLHIYTVGFVRGSGAGLLGYSTFPFEYTYSPVDDGIVILWTSLPGGSTSNYNLGLTAVHEAGHWAGLFHTFEGGCSGPGDYVSDTPAQGSPSSGCPTGADTCPLQAGKDPIFDYMDYSYDSCMTGFTNGQAVRMAAMLKQYRRFA